MIGLAFSHLVGGGTENIGYIIPNEEVDLFLKDIADGHYDGKPAMYDELQTLENPALREYLKLDKSVEGMVVHRPDKTDASYPLKEWDVMTRIGDTPIDNQGMVKLDKDLRVSFAYMIQQMANNDKVPMTIVRAGKSHADRIARVGAAPDAGHRPARQLSVLLHLRPAGVFDAQRWQLVSGFENNAGLMRLLGAVKSPLVTRGFDPPDAETEELVVISSPFFPHKLANGYSNPAGSVVYSVNGTHVRSLKHLVALLRDLKDPFVTIEFDQKGNEALVFSRTGDAGGDRRNPDRQRRAGAGLAGHDGGVAGESGQRVPVIFAVPQY